MTTENFNYLNQDEEAAFSNNFGKEEAESGLEEFAETIDIYFQDLRIADLEVDTLVENHGDAEITSEFIAQVQDLLAKNDIEKTSEYQVRTIVTVAEIFYKNELWEEADYQLEEARLYAMQFDEELTDKICDLLGMLQLAMAEFDVVDVTEDESAETSEAK